MYLNLIQIAESFGVTESVVEDWIRHEGLPHTVDRGHPLFDRAQVADWAAGRGLAAKAGFLAREVPAFSSGWRIEPLLQAGGIWRDVPASGVRDVFRKVVGTLPGATPPIRQLLAQRLGAKDGVVLAPVGGGFAMPHLSTRISLGRDSGTVALVLLGEPLAEGEATPDSIPITSLFFFVAPTPRAHLDLLGRLCRSLTRGGLREAIAKRAPDAELFDAVRAADEAEGRGPAGGLTA